MIPIYKTEIDLGLSDLIQSNASVAYNIGLHKSKDIDRAKNLSIAQKIIEKQPDLHYLDSVLVSTSWNLNDDVFLPNEVWVAKNTPVDKKFNYMHDESDIIGHMTGSLIVSNGEILDDNLAVDEIPDSFDIVVSSVLYKTWSDDSLQERMDTIIEEIDQNKWFVSMEVLFTNFDYALFDGTENKIVARNSETSFLTKHLRAYGGSGVWDNKKIGRALRNLVFCGKGLVDNPGNPKSIIFNENNPFKSVALNKSEKNDMTDSEKAVSDLQNEIKELKKENKELVEKTHKDAVASFEIEKTELNKSIAKAKEDLDAVNKTLVDKDNELKDKDKVIADLNTKLDESTKKVAEFEKQVAEIKLEKLKSDRTSSLVSVGVSSDEAKNLVEKWISVSDEMFKDIVKLHKKTDGEDVSDNAQADITDVEEPEESKAGLNTTKDDDSDDLQKATASWLQKILN